MVEPASESPDLGACDREPIHIPGSIQPHGLLFALDPDLRVRRVAGDAQALLGWDGDPRGKLLTALIETPGLEPGCAPERAEYVATVSAGGGRPLDLFVHRVNDQLIVELEPAPEVRRTGAEVLRDLLPIVTGIAGAKDVLEASQVAAAGVQRITGYDRIMIYHFLHDDSGQVIAEGRSAGVESILNHRYPASDIPQQARALYLRNPIRLIPNVGYEPAPISGGGGDLDLSGALLRSVSPVHIQYLKNMEVAASASISLVRDATLWGLIACHHRSAKPIAHEEREMCRRVALALEQAISRLEEENAQREALRLTRRREELLPLIAAAESIQAALRANIDELRRLVSADGIALMLGGEIVRSGVTPGEAEVRDLSRWLLEERSREQLVTDQLSRFYAPATGWAASAAGLLGCVASRSPLIALLWFRAEEVETVNWAGNPHKPLGAGSSPAQLTPRKSFELWTETVRGRSRPWRRNEQEAARRTASSLAEIEREKGLVELNRQLTGEVAEKDLLMREVHHRVQNSLQLVTSMLQLQEREIGEQGARDQLELARDRVLSVALLHRRLWRSEDLQNINLETFFAELVEGLVRTWSEDWENQITVDVAAVRLPAHEALLIALVVTELFTNAVKHAYEGRPGPVTVTVREAAKGRVVITVADRGIGSTVESRSDSFGSRMVKRLVSKMRGELLVEPNNPGTAVTLTVPVAPPH